MLIRLNYNEIGLSNLKSLFGSFKMHQLEAMPCYCFMTSLLSLYTEIDLSYIDK